MWQDRFARALDNPESPIPCFVRSKSGEQPTKRFAVYRNNVYSSLVNTLTESFPVVDKLVGREFFKAMASAYARSHLPTSPIMYYYGDSFGDFIHTFEAAASVPYLGDVARLEYARRMALFASDTPVLDTEQISSIDPETLIYMTPRLHPSVRLISSPYPIHAIWLKNSGKDDHSIPPHGEDVLVWRDDMTVKTQALPTGGGAFFATLLQPSTLITAAEAALEAGGDKQLETLMPLSLRLCIDLQKGKTT